MVMPQSQVEAYLRTKVGLRVKLSLAGKEWTTGWTVLQRVEIRGASIWCDGSNGESWRLPDGVDLTLIEVEAVIGTSDFIDDNKLRFEYIYRAYDMYADAPIRLRKICNCGHCFQFHQSVTGRDTEGIPYDDLGLTARPTLLDF